MTINFFSFFLILFPFSIVAGPFFTNLTISLLAIFFLVISRKKEIWYFYKNPIIITMLIFWLYIIIRSLLSNNIILSLESSLFYGRFIFFSLAIAYLLEKNKKIIIYFGYSLWTCLILVSIDAYLQFFTGLNIFRWEQLDPERISGFFREELILGSFIARLIPLAFFCIIYMTELKYKKTLTILALLFLVAFDVLVYIAGERLAFFYLIMSTILIILLVPTFRWLRVGAFILSASIIILLNYSSPDLKNRMIDHTIEQIGLNETSEELYAFSPTYQRHFSSAYKMFIDNPIFGQGPKMFRELCFEEKFFVKDACTSHPHQTYIQLLAETGALGTLPVLIIFIIISYLLFKQFLFLYFLRIKNYLSPAKVCILISMVITLWPLAPGANFFASWINAIYYLPLGFFLYQQKKDKD